MKGYKASYNGRCNKDFLFEVGKTYEFKGEPILCFCGFHFCEKPDDVLIYYPYLLGFVLFEVDAIGEVDKGADKSCTNKIEIVRVVPKEEYNKIFKEYKFDFDEKGNCTCLSRKNFRTIYTYNGNSVIYKHLKGNIVIGEGVHEYDEKRNCTKNTRRCETNKGTPWYEETWEYEYDSFGCCVWCKNARGDEYKRNDTGDAWIRINNKL
jgi:hypothetical protein